MYGHNIERQPDSYSDYERSPRSQQEETKKGKRRCDYNLVNDEPVKKKKRSKRKFEDKKNSNM